MTTPLASWFPGDGAVARFRRRWLGRAPVVLAPRDAAGRGVAPGFRDAVALAASGLPFQVAADRAYDRSADRRRLPRALAEGRTVFLPQVHQVLPRLERLIVALRVALLGPFREECSFLFLVEGRGRPGMGLHHDGEVDSFWLQLEGRRTVTLGPRVQPGTPEDLDDRLAAGGRRAGWVTRDLAPGTLFYMPARTPHRVVCHGRSLALSLTWGPRRAAPRAGRTARHRLRVLAEGLTAWDVVSGHVDAVPPVRRDRLWTQVPTLAGPVDPGRRALPVWTPGGEVWLPAALAGLAGRLALMPSVRRAARGPERDRQDLLLEHGLLAPCDLPLRIVPDDPAALDGWRFA